MRGERDFEAYATARGAAVVRGLLVLGLDLPEAEDTAAVALASLRSDWRDVGQAAEPDVVLWATVLAVDARRRRRRRSPAAPDGLVAQALRGPAGLEELQACEVLGVPIPRLRALLAATAAPDPDEMDGLDVLAVPYARVRAVSDRSRRRTWLLTSAVAAVTVLVVGLAYQVGRPEPVLRPGDDLPAVASAQRDNPSEVVWWADGTLHLADAAVEVGTVQRLVAAGRGAAYVDADGRLVAVTPDGHRTLLGRPTAWSSLVSSPRLGLVAWTDASVPDEPRIVVWDVDEGERVSGVVTSPRARTITFDGGWLTFGTGLTDWAWDPHGGTARETGNGYAEEPGERTALVDVVAGTRLEQHGYSLRVVRVGKVDGEEVPGFGGTLSPDGRLVLAGGATGTEPSLFDARTGADLGTPFPDGWQVRAATFVSDDRVAWLVDRGADGDIIVTCGLEECTDAVEPEGSDTALIAQDSPRFAVAGAG
jgi:hypothetical protein